MVSFQPTWVSAPGETIADILKERNITKSVFAQEMELSEQMVGTLLQGESEITINLARRLEKFLGGSIEFWMLRDHNYREVATNLSSEISKWFSDLPISDLIKYGWIERHSDHSNDLEIYLNFFGVRNKEQWVKKYSNIRNSVSFRTSKAFISHPASIAAWLRKGELFADSIQCKNWNLINFQESLTEIRQLTYLKDPSRFLPKLMQIAAESGVAIAIVRTPSKCHASGASYFLTDKKAIIQLSFRYLTDDHFWFTLFHEAGHLILHKGKGIFLEGSSISENVEETEANNFASEILIPKEKRPILKTLPVSSKDIIRFATELGISPGIVVGQMQYSKIIGREQLNRLKRRYRWVD
jgi:plasmid maintenance system antidote protein VapI/Zn-dependent peptidase ImmA (M78 family)